MCKQKDIILSVCVRTHNQERFIEQALNSVLSQKTKFEYEVVVSDDCSTDGTINILKKFQAQYPEKVRLIMGSENIGGAGNLRRVIEASAAKYITCLDGDDFYTDDYKLQKQVDFLELHPEYSACFHNTWIANESGVFLGLFNKSDFHRIHPAEEFILENWFVPIHSSMLRRKYIEFPEWYKDVVNDDYVVHLSVVRHGPYFFLPDVMVAYRRHNQNSSNMYHDLLFTDEKLRDVLVCCRDMYPERYKIIFDKRIQQYTNEISNLKADARCPFRKYLFLKTYKRIVRKWLSVIVR